MNEEKLIHQLFIGKVAGVIGFDKTMELLKEAKENIRKSFKEKLEEKQK